MRPAEDTCAPDEANMRAGVRIATDYVLRWTVTALRKHDGDILEALVLACLSCADTPILGAEHGLRPLRINQVAASLHLPMETVRRRFIALQDKGFIRQTKEGYVIAPLERDASLEQALAHLPQIRRLLRELAAVGVKV